VIGDGGSAYPVVMTNVFCFLFFFFLRFLLSLFCFDEVIACDMEEFK